MGGTGWGGGGGDLQTLAAHLFLLDPIPARARRLGLLSVYKFSLPTLYHAFENLLKITSKSHTDVKDPIFKVVQ
jgi:hypothetical protein